MARPGIMLYFDILEPIRALPDSDKGRLLVAMLEYGKDGIDPKFDGMLALAWGFVKPKIDRDGESYNNAKVQRKYAAFCKKRSNLNLPKVSFEEWQELDENERLRLVLPANEPQRPVDFVGSRYPSTTASATTSTSTATTAAAAATTSTSDFESTAAAAADRKLKLMQGELGQGVVILSDFQVEMLLEHLGLDMFDFYVTRLANFIIKNNANVGSHYATILKWYDEDAQT